MPRHPWMDALKRQIGSHSRRRHDRGPERSRSATAAVLETLESRRMLTVQALLAGTEIRIVSDSSDVISVRENPQAAGQVQILVNGGTFPALPGLSVTFPTALTITGGAGNNTIDVSGVSQSVFTNLASIRIDGGNGDDIITGSNDVPETLDGGDGADSITGGQGLNLLLGGDGADTISGGDTDDTIHGGDGNDLITSGATGNDSITGGDGADSITSGAGNDTIAGGDGDDSIFSDAGDDRITGEAGLDTIDAGAGNDTIYGGSHNDSLLGGDGNDTIRGNGGDDFIDGGAGNDLLNGDNGADRVTGSDDNDTVSGDAGNDDVEGGTGDDLVFGGAGNDSLFDEGAGFTNPGTSSDTLFGQAGDDTLLAFSGTDSLDGGEGNDLIDTRPLSVVANDLSIMGEGAAGTTSTALFTLTLSAPFPRQVMVDYFTSSDGTNAGGTAIAGTDYLPAMGTVTFQPGQTTATVPVTILGDDLDEVEETFFLNLVNASGATIRDGLAEGRIFDDDSSGLNGAIDIFLLLDDTGSFQNAGPVVQSAFTQIITDLQTNFPGSDLAFGVGRFEAYLTGGFSSDRPFILNQPLITDDTANFQTAIDAALQRTAPGGGRGQEPVFEALFQAATGAGFDGNGDGDSVDDGPAGLVSTQTGLNVSGDVPAYSTFTPDPLGDPLGPVLPPTSPVASATDGVGFRPGSRRVVLVATDSSTLVHEDDGQTVYTGVGGVTVNASVFANGASGLGITTPNNAGAGIQATIDALIAEGIEVVGLAETFGGFQLSPRQELEGIALLTGAVNNSSMPIENNITPGPSADDIQPGDPLYFEIDTNDPTGLANAVVQAIVGAVGNTTTPPPPPPPPPTPIVGPQADTLLGGNGDDTVFAADTNDLIIGGSGRDLLDGGGGNDTVLGGAGNDTITGGAGTDSLIGQGGNDVIDGGLDEDVLVWGGLGDGNDTLSGGDGSDRVRIALGAAGDHVTVGQSASDLLTVTQGSAALTADDTISIVDIQGGAGDDVITIGDLDRLVLTLVLVDGEAGADQLIATNSLLGNARVRLSGGIGDDTLMGSESAETLVGGEGNDAIQGGMGNDIIHGNDGFDVLDGQGGDDTVFGDAGDDQVLGGFGNDVLSGGADNDFVNGGLGDDTLAGDIGSDTLNGDAGNDVLDGGSGPDVLLGGAGNDLLDGGRNDDTLRGNSGTDSLIGNHGNDLLVGGVGDDEAVGGDGDDTLIGGDGNDGLSGGNGNDVIDGMNGQDTLQGGDGADTLRGGSGNDLLLGENGDDVLQGNGGTDTGATGEGNDAAPDSVEIINEAFVLTTAILEKLDAL